MALLGGLPGRRRRRIEACLVALLAVLPYLGILRAPFVFDDEKLVRDNPVIRDLSNIPATFDITSKRWDDEELRANYRPLRFLSYAIDYQGILAALRGAGVASSGLVPPGMFGHSSDLPVYSHDKAKAASLLNSAGYGPGKKALNLSLTYTQGDSNEQVAATIIKSDLAALNVNLSVQALAWPTQWARGKSSDAAKRQDIFMEYWWPDYPDPYSWFQGLLQTESPPYYNMSYYSNPSLDKQINGIEQLVATNKDAAAKQYRNMQVRILGTAPILFLYNANYQYAMLSGISGLKVNPAYPNVVFVYDLKP